jgi:hypothetical protein
MVQNKKTKSQIANDLTAFLGAEANSFSNWLFDFLPEFIQLQVENKGLIVTEYSKHFVEETTGREEIDIENDNIEDVQPNETQEMQLTEDPKVV